MTHDSLDEAILLDAQKLLGEDQLPGNLHRGLSLNDSEGDFYHGHVLLIPTSTGEAPAVVAVVVFPDGWLTFYSVVDHIGDTIYVMDRPLHTLQLEDPAYAHQVVRFGRWL